MSKMGSHHYPFSYMIFCHVENSIGVQIGRNEERERKSKARESGNECLKERERVVATVGDVPELCCVLCPVC